MFQFSKPENPQDLENLRQCIQEGTELINRAEKLDTNSDAVWSYKANMLVQQMRLAEMEGNMQQKEALKAEAEKAKNRFTELAKIRKDKEQAIEDEKKAKEAEAANKK